MSKIPYLETMYRGLAFPADYFAWGSGRKSAEDTEHDSYIMPLKQTFAEGIGRRRLLVLCPQALKNKWTRKRRGSCYCKGSRYPAFEPISSLIPWMQISGEQQD